MATYKYMTKDGQKVQVESAKRDGSGKNIENNYAKQTGYYSGMGVGSADLADNLTTTTGITDTTSFVFQSSGGQQDIATGYAELRALRGNSVAFNQIVEDGDFSSGLTSNWFHYGQTTLTITNNIAKIEVSTSGSLPTYMFGKVNFKGIQGHKYLTKTRVRGSTASNFYIYHVGGGFTEFTGITANTWKDLSALYTAQSSSSNVLGITQDMSNVGDYYECAYLETFDLTQMFGAGNEPTSVVEFNRLFPKPYYEYNAGTLLSSQTSAYKIVGYNAFDGEIESGYIDTSGNQSNNNRARSKNYIKVIAGQKYTFEEHSTFTYTYLGICEYDENYNLINSDSYSATVDRLKEKTFRDNTHYVRFYYIYSSDISSSLSQIKYCVHLTWSGSKTGYEPYYSFTYTMPNVELKSAGSVYDELKPDGTLVRRIGIVDLGTLDYTKSGNHFYATMPTGTKLPTGYDAPANILCGIYEKAIITTVNNETQNKTIAISLGGSVAIYDSSKSSMDATTFKTAMSGVMFYYELDTPTTEQNDAYKYDELGRIDDYGTQEFISEQTIQVPQGAEFFYQKNLKDFLNRIGSRADIDFNPNNIVSKTELSAYLTTISGYDGTKTQVLKNINGVFTWVDEALGL